MNGLGAILVAHSCTTSLAACERIEDRGEMGDGAGKEGETCLDLVHLDFRETLLAREYPARAMHPLPSLPARSSRVD